MPDKFTNLQFFPKDIAKKQLIDTMRGFSFALGVRCERCHVQSADKKMDFASDDKQEKKTARMMLRMVSAINGDYVSKIPGDKPVQVECVTCHRGIPQPRTLNSMLMDTITTKDVSAAVAQYRELRKKYYGGAQYDFGETPLNILTEALMAKDRSKDAAAIMELNLEVNQPASGWALHLAGMSHRAAGENDKAKKNYEDALKLNPEDGWAKSQLAELSKGPQ
jgi:tetratricopeptide (TPR) repeat protein